MSWRALRLVLKMITDITYRGIWKLSFPIILGLLAQNIIQVIDTAFLGRVGEVELGASAIAGVFYLAIFIAGFGFAIGTQILIGRRNGEKNYKAIGWLFDHGIYFMLFLAIVLFFLIEFLADNLLVHIIKSEEIYTAARLYLKYRIWGLFFAYFNVLFRSFYIGITKTRIITPSAMVMAIVNIILDYALIFGHWGFPEMGIAGAALASVIAEASSTVFFVVYTIFKRDTGKYGLFRFKGFRWMIIRGTLKLSVFIMLQYFLSMAGWFVFFMLIEKTGERPLAISNITRSLYIILMIPIWAFSQSVNTLVSNIIGEGRQDMVYKAIRNVTLMSLLSTLIIVAITIVIPGPMISLYTLDASLSEMTLPVIRVITGALILFSVSMVIFQAVSGTGNTQMALIIELITIFIYVAYIYLVSIVWPSSPEIIWVAEYIYFFFLGGFSLLYLKSGRWKRKEI